MSDLDLARWQFATTSIYHFFFVPVTIGLAFLVACSDMWHRSGTPTDKRLTRFFGTLLLINVAVGVVTGLVQEFEFGMNWSAYSRYVGDVFGGPLAMEGLAAFFLESTFLGHVDLRLGPNLQAGPPGLHLGGGFRTMLSAAFIMAANSWMQHPVGYVHEPPDPQPSSTTSGPCSPTRCSCGAMSTCSWPRWSPGPDHAGRLGLAPEARKHGRPLPADRHLAVVVLVPAIVAQPVRGQRARGVKRAPTSR